MFLEEYDSHLTSTVLSFKKYNSRRSKLSLHCLADLDFILMDICASLQYAITPPTTLLP